MAEPTPAPRPDEPAATPKSSGRFTLERLSSAFARLMGSPSGAKEKKPIAVAAEGEDSPADDDAPLPVTPRRIVEGLLFVGRAGGEPLTARELAAPIRDVSPEEIPGLVAELNEAYRRDASAMEIAAVDGGFRLQLRSDLAHVRQKMQGQSRAAKLTPSALEVLSIVAYRQPVTRDDVNQLRQSASQSILAQLVRRQLIRLDRPGRGEGSYVTTDRFNRLFGVASPTDLPRPEELQDN